MILNQNSLAYQFTDYGVLVFSRSKLVDTEMNNEKRKRISSDRDNQEATGVLERDGVYVAYANGIVKDTKTGLEWLAGPDKDTHWNHAKAWVESVKIGGGGWRMPTIDELEGLHKKGLTKRNMTPLLTLKTTGDSVWSSETNVLWNFNVGFIIEFTKGTGIRNNRAFAVRSTSSMAKSKGPSVSSKQTSSKPIPSRRTHAPNDSPWPIGAGYVSGYKKRHMNGLSTVTVDNSQNNSAVFVKLFSLNGSKAYPVRIFYIPAYGLFTLNKIRPGRYDVRYRDLGTGELAKSEAFDLKQTSTYKRTQYSKIRMTLYKVSHGNMQTYKISENEF